MSWLTLPVLSPAIAPQDQPPLRPLRQQAQAPGVTLSAAALGGDAFVRSAPTAFGAVASLDKPIETPKTHVPAHVHNMAFAHDTSSRNGLYFTTQLLLNSQPGKPNYPAGGGLAVVSAQTPMALNEHYGKDVRTILPANEPFVKAMKADDRWQDTNESITLPVPWAQKPGYKGDPTITYKVHQLTIPIQADKAKQASADTPDPMFTVYALTSDSKVSLKNPYVENKRDNYLSLSQMKGSDNIYVAGPEDNSKSLQLLNDKAMMELGTRLDPTKYDKPAASTLKQFEGPVKNWIVNDWLTGPIDAMQDHPTDVGYTFIVHNRYDQNVPDDMARHFGLDTPSLLNESIKHADVVMVDPNFFDTLTNTNFLNNTGQPELKHVLKERDPANTFKLHHGFGDEFSPFNNPTLEGKVEFTPQRYNTQAFLAKSSQDREQRQPMPLNFDDWRFSALAPLPKAAGQVTHPQHSEAAPSVAITAPGKALTQAQRHALQAQRNEQTSEVFNLGAQRSISQAEANHLLAWKSEQKQALQHLTGMKADPQANVISWTNRLDAFQKLFDVVADELPSFMHDNPHAQFVICADYKGDNPRFNQFIATMGDEFKDRFAILPFNANTQKLVTSGSTFALLPSLYEPYGTAQLQAMALGAIPIASDIDGLRSTVTDPAVASAPHPEAAWAYGQTGVLLPYVDPTDIAKVFSAREKMKRADNLNYQEFTQRLQQDGKHDEAATWKTMHHNLRQALDRGVALVTEPNQHALVMKNGMDFMHEQHNWQTIAQLYLPAFSQAEAIANQRTAKAHTN
jgi:glycosyltransferase involved in cell wall biosynthesis